MLGGGAAGLFKGFMDSMQEEMVHTGPSFKNPFSRVPYQVPLAPIH